MQYNLADGLTGLIVCGVCHRKNAAMPTASNYRKWLTCGYVGSRFTAIATTCYPAGVAVRTRYDRGSPAAEPHIPHESTSPTNSV